MTRLPRTAASATATVLLLPHSPGRLQTVINGSRGTHVLCPYDSPEADRLGPPSSATLHCQATNALVRRRRKHGRYIRSGPRRRRPSLRRANAARSLLASHTFIFAATSLRFNGTPTPLPPPLPRPHRSFIFQGLTDFHGPAERGYNAAERIEKGGMRAGHAGCRGRDVVWTYGTRWIVPEVSGGPVPCQTKATCERVGTGLEKCIYTPRGGTVRPRHPSEWFGIDTAYTTPPTPTRLSTILTHVR